MNKSIKLFSAFVVMVSGIFVLTPSCSGSVENEYSMEIKYNPDDLPSTEDPKDPIDIDDVEKPRAEWANPEIEDRPLVDCTKWEIKNGKFYLDGTWKFLKIAKPLLNYAGKSNRTVTNTLLRNLDNYRERYFSAISMNCYWHLFDANGDGKCDTDPEALAEAIEMIYEKGMYPVLSVETYAVGGGTVPEGFWSKHPEAQAVDYEGNLVTDTEYGFNSKVPSIFNKDYRNAVTSYIKDLASKVNTDHILYFETTVEPQYMGAEKLDYGEDARAAYNEWRKKNNITDAASEMPRTFPMPSSFVKNETWNRFRAEALAACLREDAEAYRSVAGEKAYVAVDYLDADEGVQIYRTGDPLTFLTNLDFANIIQVNWHWNLGTMSPNTKAYDRVYAAMEKNGCDWVISEHMTFNGDCYTNYSTANVDKVLENTISKGTRFGWEFTNTNPSSTDTFSLYDNDFNPKYPMSEIDKYWGYWLHRVRKVEKDSKK